MYIYSELFIYNLVYFTSALHSCYYFIQWISKPQTTRSAYFRGYTCWPYFWGSISGLAYNNKHTVYTNIFAAKIFGGQALKVSVRREWYTQLGPKISQWKHDKYWPNPVTDSGRISWWACMRIIHTHAAWVWSTDDKHAKNMRSKSLESSNLTEQNRPPWSLYNPYERI
jgi:hypothetical protein